MSNDVALPEDRDAVLRAAAHYDGIRNHIARLEDEKRDLETELEAKQVRIDQLELAIVESENRAAMWANRADEKTLIASELTVAFYNIAADVRHLSNRLEQMSLPLPPLPSKRRRKAEAATTNGNGNGHETVSDPAPAPDVVASAGD